MTYQLRPHQEIAISKIRDSFRRGNRTPLLQAPTGFGKTLIAVDIIKSALAKGKRVIFIVDRIQLIDQTSEAMDFHGIPHGVVQGDHWRVNNEPLQIASLQTFMKRRNKPEADLVIVDDPYKGPEDSGSPTYRQTVKDLWESTISTPTTSYECSTPRPDCRSNTSPICISLRN